MSSEDDGQGSQDEQSQDENDSVGDKSERRESISLTSFLFGNVDERGELETDFLDEETKKSLNSLERLGVSRNLLSDIVSTEEVEASDDGQSNDSASSDKESGKTESPKEPSEGMSKNEDFNVKSPSAVDYFDISELADEDEKEKEREKEKEKAKEKEEPPKAPFKMPPIPLKLNLKGIRKSATDDEDDDYDKPLKEGKDSRGEERESRAEEKESPSGKEPVGSETPTSAVNGEEGSKSGLHTPLAAMLPSKYKGVDVKEIFPEFRPNAVLRFSRLFGPGKVSHLPQPWKHVQNKRKKRPASETISSLEAFERMQRARTSEGEEPMDVSSDSERIDSERRDREKGMDMEGSQEVSETEFQLDLGGTVSPSEVATDDEDVLMRPMELKDYSDSGRKKGSSSPKIADWRYGPAQYWYDFIGVPESGEGFDYGLKMKPDPEEPDPLTSLADSGDPDEAFHLVTQLQWEDDIIWNGDDIKQKVLAKLNDKNHAAGWVPSGVNRTASSFTQQAKTKTSSLPLSGPCTSGGKGGKGGEKGRVESQESDRDETWYSIFPVENEELVYGSWEEDIIWDAEAMKKIPEPRILTLDPNDENIVLGIPEDVDPSKVEQEKPAPIPLKEKKEHHLKKSKIILGKAGVIAEVEPDVPPPAQNTARKDPFNISNDEFYNPRMTQDVALKPNVGGNLIQHSIPALELRQPFFPTHMGQLKLRAFHRPPLKRFSHGTIADTLSHAVNPLLKHIKKKQKQREQERISCGGGEMFFMRTPEDLSGKDGDLILAEMSEEHPPLVMQVGMATKIKNYFKRKPGITDGPPEYEFGETAFAHSSYFLGNLAPGQSMQTFENNLYRAPIYTHSVPQTDFLIIRTRNAYFIRELDTIFTVGQQLPLFEVPGPNSKKANNFIRDFLQVFIYRLFWKSTDVPRRIKMEDIKKAFPSHSESSIRKRLKLCADFKRTGMDSNWWVLKSEFRLPAEDEIRALVSPEQCCAYYSMIAAEQRLKDAGYGEKSLFAAEDDDEDLQLKMEDEVKAAPWNTTRAFISAMKGKCLLQLNGVADPTGCGEGFSYVRIPNKPQIGKDEQTAKEAAKEKKTVTGTDADLRRLPLNQAKNLLRKFGVPEEEIKKLSRWEVIDVVRTLSTEQAKAGSDSMSKFARGNRFSIAEHQERYKEECQRVFDLQNRVLGSKEELSTDEDESEEEDSDIEEMGKNIESMLSNKKTSQDISLEKEEAERLELRKLFMGEESNQGDERMKKKKEEEEETGSLSASVGKILKIYRTYKSGDGKEYVRIETVRKPAIIDTYVRIRQTKSDEFIQKFATALNEEQKEEKRREKRRIQEQLRRLKKNEERAKKGLPPLSLSASGRSHDRSFSGFDEVGTGSREGSPVPGCSVSDMKRQKKGREKKAKKEKDIKMKCGACGAVGHMKTNRLCPLFRGGDGSLPPVPVAMTEEQEEAAERDVLEERESLVKVDETKIVFSKTLITHAEELKKKTLVLKVPKELMKRKRRAGTTEHCDYLHKPDRAANRRRTDPRVSLQLLLDEICGQMKEVSGSDLFWVPVNVKQVPDYYDHISIPMDLQSMRKNVKENRYSCRSDFMKDVDQIILNSTKYNGPNHVLTATAIEMKRVCEDLFQQKGDKLKRLERAINPLLDDNDQVAFSYLLETFTNNLKSIPDSWPFHKPVDKKKVKDYYDRIKTPMDLETIETLVRYHKYTSVDEYVSDVNQVYENSLIYNGPESVFTKKAKEIVHAVKEMIAEHQERLTQLESSITATKEAALDAADSESVFTGSHLGDRDDLASRPGSSAAPSVHEGSGHDEGSGHEGSGHGGSGHGGSGHGGSGHGGILGDDDSRSYGGFDDSQGLPEHSQLLGRDLTPDSLEAGSPQASSSRIVARNGEGEGEDMAREEEDMVREGEEEDMEEEEMADEEVDRTQRTSNPQEEDDVVDENYDPEAFLLGLPSVAPAPSHADVDDADVEDADVEDADVEDADVDDADVGDADVGDAEEQGGRATGMEEMEESKPQPAEEPADDDGLWF